MTQLKDLYVLLRKGVNFYLQFIEYKSFDGFYHLPETISPEYPNTGPDTNYDLMLLKWACQTLVKIVSILNVNDELEPQWQKVIRNMVPYPRDLNGSYGVAYGVPFEQSHRHYSHLFAIYPLGTLEWHSLLDIGNVVEKSVDNWIGRDDVLTGFSYSGAASMSSRMGRAEAVLGNLTFMLDNFITPNTFYFEGANFPVMETPLTGAEVVHDMLLQSWGDDGLIRVFPAISTKWPDASFSKLLAEGAFEVSAVRKNRTTQFIQITSLRGSPCKIQTDLLQPIVAYPASFNITVSKPPNRNGVVDVNVKLPQGESVVLYTKGGDVSSFYISPVPGNRTQFHFWGFHPTY